VNEGELMRIAIEKIKRDEAPYRVAASFAGETTPRDLDGVRWTVIVTDGLRGPVRIEAVLSRTQGGYAGMDIEPAVVEAAVERKAGAFDVATRLGDLTAASPLVLRPDDLRPHTRLPWS
jgi:hypothetical protein